MNRKNIVTIGILGLAALILTACSVMVNQPQGARRETTDSVPMPTSEPEITKRLILRNSGISELPGYVLDLVNLEELDISDNAIAKTLPAEIRTLSKLRILDMSGNRMTNLPAEIGQLTELEQLDLANNQLTGLPYELGNLTKLRTLILSGNPYSEQDLAVIREKLPTTNIIL